MLVKLPLELNLCRLVIYAASFGNVVDGVLLATALTAQDPFHSRPIQYSKTYGDHRNESALWGPECRRLFDAGQLSDPIMIRNLIVHFASTYEKRREKDGKKKNDGWDAGWEREGRGGGSNSNTSLHFHAKEFAITYKVSPKRVVQLCYEAMDIANRLLEFCEKRSNMYRDLTNFVQLFKGG